MDYKEGTEKEEERIKDAGFRSFMTISAEDLLDFEHDSSALDRGVEAWAKFMQGWGVKPDLARIRKRLMEFVGEYPAEPQSSTIYNYEEVSQVLGSAPDLKSLLR